MTGSLTPATLRRRFRVFGVTMIVIIAGTTVASYHAGYARRAPSAYQSYTGSNTHYGPPTAAEQAATLAATVAYRRLVVQATQAFASTTSELVSAIEANDRSEAQADEVAAQQEYDLFRSNIAAGLGAQTPLDELIANQSPALARSGLHAVEEALWHGSVSAALTPASAIAEQAPLIEEALLRTIVTPSVICQRVAEALGWVVEDVIDQPQEVYSHRDAADVVAVTDLARGALDPVESLAKLVDPTDRTAMVTDLGALAHAVSGLTSTTVDTAVPVAQWRRVASAIDVLEVPLGRLTGTLGGYGTGRNYA